MSGHGHRAERLLVAVGGNAIHPSGIRGTPSEQLELAARAGRVLLPIMQRGTPLVVTAQSGHSMRIAAQQAPHALKLSLPRTLRRPRRGQRADQQPTHRLRHARGT